MPFRVVTLLRSALLTCITLMLVFSVMGRPTPSHDLGALAQTTYQQHVVADTHDQEAGHSHDVFEDDLQISGHLHGHNSADHSHEAPAEAHFTRPVISAEVGKHVAQPVKSLRYDLASRLERPPRPFLL
ncbi:hypothetical protein PsAD13_02227 [Pseudovibrio sp. Ad13]|uniref:hypothetical protein n=1 Tax=unclassified Pseudovibrio TaxID=2627060 RepID=UPI0007B1F8E4|nr:MULTISPECIES: hypothetical protein [unclassified Pseudovibrio]KZK84762.1 hypothetical protein PsAD13_02227 [Pseudovibrio sp. Ad13]KZK92768.1 hypothetical protein PsAD5_03489 [Pseudovibrio sp. Ad5]